ncbi:MAG: prepilin-type N-terminal cleavage/methylation domain-containing protein [Verrucomicrobia bacterium]|nr:prepilin-type N-terminal cleavage/methylation domain-containing protein [Verrucomicrobiota bacterium]
MTKLCNSLVQAKESNSRGRAFTLIELLVVIAILGILAGLLLPALSYAKAHARSTACKNHLRQMGIALQMYVHENGSKYPYGVNPYAPEFDDAVGVANTRYWWAKLLPYYPVKWTVAKYHCPGYKGAIVGEVGSRPPFGAYAYNQRGVRPPVSGHQNPNLGINIRFPDDQFGLGPTYHKSSPFRAVSESQIKVPSEMLAICESRFLNAKVNGYPGGECDTQCGFLRFPYNGAGNEFAFGEERHGKNYNQLFCDGHVAAMNPWVLFNPTNTAPMWNYDHQPHPELWMPDY